MNRRELYKTFPMVFHEVTADFYDCFEFAFSEPVFGQPDVGLHVICHPVKEGKIEYLAWCYIKNIPLARFVRSESVPCNNTEDLRSVQSAVVNHIVDDEQLLGGVEQAIEWINVASYSKEPLANPHGSEIVEAYNCFEFSLPECVYNRSDIKLQMVYRRNGEKGTECSVWCRMDRSPLLEYIGHVAIPYKDEDSICQDLITALNQDDRILQRIADYLNRAEVELGDDSPVVTYSVSTEEFHCIETHMQNPALSTQNVGLHVLYHLTEDGEVEYFAWGYIVDIPLLRLVGHEKLSCDDHHPRAVYKLVVDSLFDNSELFESFEEAIQRIDGFDLLENPVMIVHGTEDALYESFEFLLPNCEDDIKLQVTYDAKNKKTIKYSAWCYIEDHPLMGHLEDCELPYVEGADVVDDIMRNLYEADRIYEEIGDFLSLLDSFDV